MKKIICILIVLSWTGCSSNKLNGLIYYQDFEDLRSCNPLFLTTSFAHSGKYANKLDSKNTYGITPNFKFKYLSDKKIKGVKINFWVCLSDTTAKGKFVVEVNEPNSKNAFWVAKSIDVLDTPPGKWKQICMRYTFDKENISQPDNTIRFYPWNISTKEIYIDDLTIEFESMDLPEATNGIK